MTDTANLLRDLWRQAGGEPGALERVTLTGADPVLPTDFMIGTAASAVLGASALAAAELWRLRTGRAQTVSVDARAAVAAFKSERFLHVDGRPVADVRGPIFGFYPTADGRFIQLHVAMPHHLEGALRFLGCPGERDAVTAAVSRWEAQALEDALAAQGLPVGMVRSRAEWQSHAQGRAVGALPLFEIMRIGDGPRRPCGAGGRPLSRVRVLDLTRVLAGPACGRALASHGADVLRITNPHLYDHGAHVMDMGIGKLSATLDLRRADDVERLRGLVRGCDVFSQSFRPGALARYGFSPDEVARLRPGVVYVTLSAFGHDGPWRERRGFETLVESVTGMADEQGRWAGLAKPLHLPAQVVDQGTGYLAAFGALIALARRAREGGSWLVRVSLAQTGHWVDALGRADGRAGHEMKVEDIGDLMTDCDSPFGRLRHVVPGARLSETPAYWSRPAVPLGTHEPAWPSV